MIWIPEDLFEKAQQDAKSNELERETFIRLVRAGLGEK